MEKNRNSFTNVFVNNLDHDTDEDDLERLFSVCGDIISHKIARNDSGHSNGYAYVEFSRADEAIDAINKFNGVVWHGKKISVKKFIPKDQRESIRDKKPVKYTNIYVKNFDQHWSEDNLQDLFQKFGTIVSLKVEKDENRRSRGFGYINFSNHTAAARAVSEMNGKLLRNKKNLYVAPFESKAQRQNKRNHQQQENAARNCNLYVKNLNTSIDDNRLKKMFSPYGNISSAKVITENGISKMFGFVCYDTQEAACKAINEMNGKVVASKKLYVGWYEKKEQRRARLAEEQKRVTSKTYIGLSQAQSFVCSPLAVNVPQCYQISPKPRPIQTQKQGYYKSSVIAGFQGPRSRSTSCSDSSCSNACIACGTHGFCDCDILKHLDQHFYEGGGDDDDDDCSSNYSDSMLYNFG